MEQTGKYDALRLGILQGFKQVTAVGGDEECINIYALLDFRDDEKQKLEDSIRATDPGLKYELKVRHPGVFRELE